MAENGWRTKTFSLLFSAMLLPWCALLVRFIFLLAVEVPNVVGKRIFAMMVLWMVATHAVTVIIGPWAAWEIWKSRKRGLVAGAAIAGNLALHNAAVLVLAGLGGLEYLATLLLSAFTLIAMIALALKEL